MRVPAITEFIDTGKAKITESARVFGPTWPCIDCHRTNNLPDLKTACRPCEKTLFKPRDLFKSLPDIDVVLVFAGATSATETAVEAHLNASGLIQSDNDIQGAYNRTMGAISAVADQPAQKLPVDAHIWDMQKFEAACAQLQAEPQQGMVPITSRSLHARWEDHRMNFWFDFVFSLTEVGDMDPTLQETVVQTRRTLVQKLGATGLLEIIPQVSRRGKTILADRSLYNAMRARLESWQNS